jgi:hypothetical protein
VPSMTTWGLDQSNVEEPASLLDSELDMDALMRELEAG